MNNFQGRKFDQQLLKDMYAVPTKELSTEQIAEVLSEITGKTIDTLMVSKLFNAANLDLRKRNRVAPKEETQKVKRVTKASVVNELLDQLGLVVVVNGEEGPDPDDENEELTEEEQEHIDETIEANQYARTMNLYDTNGVA